ncbi:MAG: hypothetical protein JRF33_16860 [Deltaproteobacteria bacterium]|nr:hypothetical protein [Deltaproteobacteria bacterium]
MLSGSMACDDKQDPPRHPSIGQDASSPNQPDGNEEKAAPAAEDGGLQEMDGGDAVTLDAGLDAVDGTDVASDGDQSAELPLKTGVFMHEGLQVIQAIGRAPKSVDMGLARSAAAARARSELGKILKKQGIQTDAGQVQGASIESTWRKGRWIYALARIRLENKTKEKDKLVNESTSGSSNSAEPTKTNPAPSEGGRTK